MFALLETDFDVHVTGLGAEFQVGVFGPDAKGTGDFLVHVLFGQFWGVFGDFVGEVLRLPSASYTPKKKGKTFSIRLKSARNEL